MKSFVVVFWAGCDAGTPRPQPAQQPVVAESPTKPLFAGASPEAVALPMNRLPEVLGPSAPVTPPALMTPQLPFVTANGHTYAIVQVRSVIPEACTNMGGTDWSFAVAGMPPDYRLHGGGHGIFGRGTRLPGVAEEIADDASWRDRYYVADVLVPSHGRFTRRVLCSNKELTFDGSVVAVTSARDLADARAQLAAVPREGLRGAVRIDTFDR
ncbi:MAG: hypothetical protein ABJE66_05475 [Deltaproteobacteria bacterium]